MWQLNTIVCFFNTNRQAGFEALRLFKNDVNNILDLGFRLTVEEEPSIDTDSSDEESEC